MKNIRTDLAVEIRELVCENTVQTTELSGVIAREYTRNFCPVTYVEILNSEGAEIMQKPEGRYVTIEIPGLMRKEPDFFANAVNAVSEELLGLLKTNVNLNNASSILCVGLGNSDITPDAIGPKVMRNCVVTRHLVEKMPAEFGAFRPVAAITPGVLGMTGMESAETIRGAAQSMKPSAILIIDALTSRRLSRLCQTVQLSDSGIVPGSGVGNSRAELSKGTLGVPVISIGVPTVVDAVTLTADLCEQAGNGDIDYEEMAKFSGGLMVTPKEIDTYVNDIAKVVGYAINLTLQEGMSIEDITGFLG